VYAENLANIFAITGRRKHVDEKPGAGTRHRLLLVMALLLPAVLLFCAWHSRAQVSPPGHHPYHADFYTGWQRADGSSCCSDRDCRPATTRMRGEIVQVLIDGQWVDVPPRAIRPYAAPDLGDHVCAVGKRIFCLVRGQGV
jgi:hypothetical protein